MQYQELLPHKSLSDHIACYFFMEVEKENEEELVIPDGTAGLMIVQEGSFRRFCPSSKINTELPSGSYLFGQKTKPVHYSFDVPSLQCLGVKFQPQGLKSFHRFSNSEITDTMESATAVFGSAFEEIVEKLRGVNSVNIKKELLDVFFQKALPDDIEASQKLVQCLLQFIHQRRGRLGVADLIEHFKLGYKQLERLFKKFVGVSPKTYCCITRFNAAVIHQKNNCPENLTHLAYSSGYFDQMHFIKEVKHFTHLTPKEFFKSGLGQLGMQQRELVAERLGH